MLDIVQPSLPQLHFGVYLHYTEVFGFTNTTAPPTKPDSGLSAKLKAAIVVGILSRMLTVVSLWLTVRKLNSPEIVDVQLQTATLAMHLADLIIRHD